MDYLSELIKQFGLVVVFVNVFLEQIGLPIPAYPTLVLAGALISSAQLSITFLISTAIIAAVMADTIWYFAGRKYGKSVLGKLCKISLSPDSCVSKSQSLYLNYGPPALLVCKFIPGFASISSALAGSTGTRLMVFLIMDGLGAALWAGSALWLGIQFQNAIDELLTTLVEMGKWGSLVMLALLITFVLFKWIERQRFLKSLRMARISVIELNTLISKGLNPLIVDTRSDHLVEEGWIPGASFISLEKLNEIPQNAVFTDPIVLYCSCPNEVTAAKVAKAFISKGYTNVRPLSGGIDAWRNAGFHTENSH